MVRKPGLTTGKIMVGRVERDCNATVHPEVTRWLVPLSTVNNSPYSMTTMSLGLELSSGILQVSPYCKGDFKKDLWKSFVPVFRPEIHDVHLLMIWFRISVQETR